MDVSNQWKLVVASILLLTVILFYSFISVDSKPQAQYLNTQEVKINNHTLTLEVADTEKERRTGLMHRKNLDNSDGMLFKFNSSKPRSFWMKDTYIPLDIIFLDKNKQVVDIKQAEPDTGEIIPNRYTSEKPAKYVVELEKNAHKTYNISQNDTFIFPD